MSKAKAYLTSFRLRKLPLSLSGVLLGSLLAACDGYFKAVTFTWAILTTVALQILSNLANEVGDLDKGTDNEHRIGPIRSAQSGALSRQEMIRAMLYTACIAVVSGCLLIFHAFGDLLHAKSIVLLIAGGASIVAAVKYTFGRHAYGYRGWGDFFVFIFFGGVSVLGSYFSMTGFLPLVYLLPATTIGLLSTGVLNLNNMRDIENDAICGKRTIPVLIGIRNAKIYHYILITTAWITLVLYTILHPAEWCGYLFLLTIPLFIIHLKHVRKYTGSQLDPQLKVLSISTFLLTLFVIGGQYLGK